MKNLTNHLEGKKGQQFPEWSENIWSAGNLPTAILPKILHMLNIGSLAENTFFLNIPFEE